MKRMTKQRIEILKCLSNTGRPLFIEEILSFTITEIPLINLSTIYRTIKTLINEDKIDIISLPGEKTCYTIKQKGHQHYFVCDGCNKTYFIYKCPQGVSEIAPQGFQVLGHSITLTGFCQECHTQLHPLKRLSTS